MSPKLKGAALCIFATMVGFVVWNLVIGVTPALMGVLIVGGGTGLISALAITFIRGGQAPIPVGIATMCALWLAFVLVMLDGFGTSGLDVTRLVVGTVMIASIGALQGFAYKFGAR